MDPPPSGLGQLAAFLGLGVLLALVGLIDDLGKGLTPGFDSCSKPGPVSECGGWGYHPTSLESPSRWTR